MPRKKAQPASPAGKVRKPRTATVSASAKAGLSLDRFSQIVGVIYAAAIDRQQWPTALEEIRTELAANYVSLIIQPSTDDDNGLIVSVATDHGPISPVNPPLVDSPFTGIPHDHLVNSADMLSEAQWRASSYYHDWCEPHNVFHVLAADLTTQDGSIYGFRVTRQESAPAFSKADCEIGRRLLPHLKQALDIHQSACREQEVRDVYSRAMARLMVGVILLDEHKAVIESNAAAESILSLDDGLRVTSGRLVANYTGDNQMLQRLLRDALEHLDAGEVGSPQAMSIGRPSGQFSWGLVVQAISPDRWTEGKHRPSIAVFVRDSEGRMNPSVRFAQQLFRMTPAETALTTKLINGLSLEEAAKALNIRRNTARAHLRSIFSKTGVRRQAELVRIFLNSVAWFKDSRK